MLFVNRVDVIHLHHLMVFLAVTGAQQALIATMAKLVILVVQVHLPTPVVSLPNVSSAVKACTKMMVQKKNVLIVPLDGINRIKGERFVCHAHQVNFKMFPVRPSVNFVTYRPTLVAKPETGRALIVRQDGHPRRGALNAKPAELEHMTTAVNHAH